MIAIIDLYSNLLQGTILKSQIWYSISAVLTFLFDAYYLWKLFEISKTSKLKSKIKVIIKYNGIAIGCQIAANATHLINSFLLNDELSLFRGYLEILLHIWIWLVSISFTALQVRIENENKDVMRKTETITKGIPKTNNISSLENRSWTKNAEI